jgi:hypothetical protein
MPSGQPGSWGHNATARRKSRLSGTGLTEPSLGRNRALESARKRAACSDVKERRFSAASKEPREERGFSPRDLHGKLCRNRPWQAGGRAVAPMASALPEERNGRQTHSFRNSILLAVRISVLEKLPYCAAICRLVRECMPDTTFVNRVFAVSQRTSEGTTPSPPWSFSTAFHKRIAIPVTNNLY